MCIQLLAEGFWSWKRCRHRACESSMCFEASTHMQAFLHFVSLRTQLQPSLQQQRRPSGMTQTERQQLLEIPLMNRSSARESVKPSSFSGQEPELPASPLCLEEAGTWKRPDKGRTYHDICELYPCHLTQPRTFACNKKLGKACLQATANIN